MFFTKKRYLKKPIVPICKSRPVSNNITSSDYFLNLSEYSLYEKMRNTIPIIDAAIEKIKHLLGDFKFKCTDQKAEQMLQHFKNNVQVGYCSYGLECFIQMFLDSILMYGCAVGEMVFDSNLNLTALLNANVPDLTISPGKNPLTVDVVCDSNSTPISQEKLLFAALNPQPGSTKGKSLLSSLITQSNLLLKVFNAIGENYDRISNIRFALTYEPKDNDVDKAYLNQRAEQIAKEWSLVMNSGKQGEIRDFIYAGTGDIKIQTIGASDSSIDYATPTRILTEQIVSKLSLPPFLLGLHWNNTETMCVQQTKFLIAEIKFYRRLLNPIILKIATTFLNSHNLFFEPSIQWETLNFNDVLKASQSRLLNAQAEKLEFENSTQ